MVRLAVTITRNQHDAEDAVQSVLVQWLRPRATESRGRAVALSIANGSQRVGGDPSPPSPYDDAGRIDRFTDAYLGRSSGQEESFVAVWLALRPTSRALQSEVVVLKVWEGLTLLRSATLAVSPATATSRYRYAARRSSPYCSHRKLPWSKAVNAR
ncbi:MAG: sigma-70 family RNA polymerase sigma factor [Pirellulaceae bacterium]